MRTRESLIFVSLLKATKGEVLKLSFVWESSLNTGRGEGERDSVVGVLLVNWQQGMVLCQVADSIEGCGRYFIGIVILMKE